MKKHKLIKLISLITAFTLILSSLCIPSFAEEEIGFYEDFESVAIGEKPSDFTFGEAGGTIEVGGDEGNKYLCINNSNDGVYSSVNKSLSDISEQKYSFQFDFMQNEVRPTETVPFEIKSGDDVVFRIHTREENIVYDTNLLLDESNVLVEDYYANKWYSFIVTADLKEKNVSIYIDGELVEENAPLLSSTDSLSCVSAYTAYSPGFKLDNLSCEISREGQTVIDIVGNDALAIPGAGSIKYEFSSYVLNELGIRMKSEEVIYAISDNNIQYEVDGNKLYIIIDSTANPGSFDISVMSKNNQSVTETKTVKIEDAQVSSVSIISSERITYNNKQENIFPFYAVAYDQCGNVIQGAEFTYSAESPFPENVELNINDNYIKVTGPVINHSLITIKAEENDSSKTVLKTIAVLDEETYRRDETRLEAVKQYVDRMLIEASDKYNNTPLLANGVEVATGQHTNIHCVLDSEHPNKYIVPSDIGEQYQFMRTLYGLSAITGDRKYKNRADAVYKHYIDEKLYSPINGLLYTGGHCCIDLKTGKYSYAGGYSNIHEYKDHFGFYEPFFSLDHEFAENYLKAVFLSHFYDLKNLFFNRHSHFDTVVRIDKAFNDLNVYDESDLSVITDCTGITFRIAGNDMMYCLLELYEKTGETEALVWARRILDRFIAAQDPNTHISAGQYNTGYQDPNCYKLPDKWWLRSDYESFTISNYGDRLNNQFADEWINDGLFTEEERGYIIEPNWTFSTSSYGASNLVDLKIANIYGTDTETGKYYLINTAKAMAGFIKYAYVPEKNVFNIIMNNGTVITGRTVGRNGYYGKAGNIFGTNPSTSDIFCAACMIYSECMNVQGDDEYDEAKIIIWNYIKNYCMANGMGDIGDNLSSSTFGDLSTTEADPKVLIALLKFYETSRNPEILKLARRIGDNIVGSHYVNGYFVDNSSNLYSKLDNEYILSLLYLDAATKNDFTSVPEYYMSNGFFHTSYVDERGREKSPEFDNNFLWPKGLSDIFITDIIPEKTEYTMKPGEKINANVKILPEDAGGTVNWYSDNPNVAMMDSDGNICAYSSGTVKLIGISGSNIDLTKRVVKTEIYITVTDKNNTEE